MRMRLVQTYALIISISTVPLHGNLLWEMNAGDLACLPYLCLLLSTPHVPTLSGCSIVLRSSYYNYSCSWIFKTSCLTRKLRLSPYTLLRRKVAYSENLKRCDQGRTQGEVLGINPPL